MFEIRFDKTKDEVALLIWFLVDHSVPSMNKVSIHRTPTVNFPYPSRLKALS
jgi:hypothetical protein